MMDLKKIITAFTILLFIYNVIFTWVIFQFTVGPERAIFLILVAVDYIIIFYFVLGMASEFKFRKKKTSRRGR
jgi:hypothetical protein